MPPHSEPAVRIVLRASRDCRIASARRPDGSVGEILLDAGDCLVFDERLPGLGWAKVRKIEPDPGAVMAAEGEGELELVEGDVNQLSQPRPSADVLPLSPSLRSAPTRRYLLPRDRAASSPRPPRSS